MNILSSRSFFIAFILFSVQETYAKKIDYIKIQHAGEIGYYALGLGKDVSPRYSIEFFYGNVPESEGGVNIDTVAMKNFWKFLDFKYSNVFVQPYAGVNIYHVRGHQYQSSRNQNYPDSYYRIGSIRGMLFLGGDFKHGNFLSHHFYFESGMNDIILVNLYNNTNAIEAQDYISLALGYRYDF